MQHMALDTHGLLTTLETRLVESATTGKRGDGGHSGGEQQKRRHRISVSGKRIAAQPESAASDKPNIRQLPTATSH